MTNSLLNSANKGNTNSVKALLSTPGVDVNEADRNGNTPLLLACCNGHVGVVRLLLAHPKIQINKEDKVGVTPLYCASARGRTEIVKLLLARPTIYVNKADNEDGETPLYRAVDNGHTEVVRLLLAHPLIKVNKAAKDGSTPLSISRNLTIKNLLKKALGLKIGMSKINNNQKMELLKQLIAKTASNKTFIDPLTLVNYSTNNLTPINKNNKPINSLGMILNANNKPVKFVNADVLREALKNSGNGTIRGIFYNNWTLVNVSRKEYVNVKKEFP